MTRRTMVFGVALAAVLGLPAVGDEPKPAPGGPGARGDQKLEERIRALEEQQVQIQKALERMRQEQVARAVDQKVAEEEKKIKVTLDWKEGFTIKTTDGQHELHIGGYVQFDGRFRLDDDDPKTDINTFDVRRAKLGASGKVYKYYEFKVEADLRVPRLDDAWMNFHYWDPAQLKLGQYKMPFGFEELTSARYVKFVDRSIATRFITPGRDIGGMLHGKFWDNRVEYAAGLFNGAGQNRTDTNDDKDVAGRLVFKPFAPSKNLWVKGIHLGGAATWGEQPLASISGTGPTSMQGTRLFSFRSGTSQDGERTRYGVEGAWTVGPVGLLGEWMQMNREVRLTSGSGRTLSTREALLRTSGWHATGSWMITGEDATWGRVKPKSVFDPQGKKVGTGAWELVARVGQILGEKEILDYATGTREATEYAAGLNWYPNSMLRISLNYAHTAFGHDTLSKTTSEDGIFFRVQLEY